MNSTLLQIFIFVDVFIIGALMPFIFRHAHMHFRPEKHKADKPQMPAVVKERLLHNSEVQYQKVLDHSVDVLQRDLDASASQINGLVTRFAGVIVGDEMERYRSELSKLHKQAEADMSNIRQEISGHEAEIKEKYQAEMELEKQRLISQIDTKLGDAVGSFLIETLQHNVDLGNQTQFLLAMLEEHREEFKQEVTTE